MIWVMVTVWFMIRVSRPLWCYSQGKFGIRNMIRVRIMLGFLVV